MRNDKTIIFFQYLFSIVNLLEMILEATIKI